MTHHVRDSNIRLLSENDFACSNLDDADSEFCSGIFCPTGTDNLLETAVSKVHAAAKPTSDDNDSCKTVLLTKMGSSSVLNTSPSHGRVNVSDQMQGELSGLPKSLAKLDAVGSCSFKSKCSKEDAGNFSGTSFVCGSQINSCAEQAQINSCAEHAHSMKHNSSASDSYSKMAYEFSKLNRIRLKSWENPRLRPEDHKMIEDCLKELRELVPNGAKCSIDVLLERTIKHMLFLQSVTKDADKLKQTGESKIISTDGGVLFEYNFEGGRTMAYEFGIWPTIRGMSYHRRGSQSTPSNACGEHDLFVEIADIIRGL